MASVNADFDTKTAIVSVEPGKSLSKADCEKAFEGTNYGVGSFEAMAAAE